jgi:hypothetical protein
MSSDGFSDRRKATILLIWPRAGIGLFLGWGEKP